MAAVQLPVFDEFGKKRVTKTDKDKGAYVPTVEQTAAIAGAGIQPAHGVTFDVVVLFDPTETSVKATYYHAARSEEASRRPEPRMSGPFISSWLNKGDSVVIGNIGGQLFAYKVAATPVTADDIVNEVAKKANPETILKRAKKAAGKPARRTVQRDVFVRDPFVVAGALVRAGGECEMPGCACSLFLRDDDTPYLEVHHVITLAEGGDDTLANVAALCPHCHRILHHGKDRKARRTALSEHIATLKV